MKLTEPEDAPEQEPLKVLVVDDTRLSRLLIAGLVQALGHRFETAVNGERGWHVARNQYPDLIVTDLEMPVWTGFDLIRTIRASGNPSLRQVPIIVCSTRRDHPHLFRAMEMGADAFVTKPVHASELRIAIQNAILKPHTEASSGVDALDSDR